MSDVRKKVLVVDDDPRIRKAAGDALARDGYAVLTAKDGIEAFQSVETERPDLVILDLLLPRRDGYTVLFHLRSRPATQSTPVLFVSGEPASEHAEIAQTLGAQGFISKPFKADTLLATVKATLAGDRTWRVA
jgi:DNA-binding response OmpR family regulator